MTNIAQIKDKALQQKNTQIYLLGITSLLKQTRLWFNEAFALKKRHWEEKTPVSSHFSLCGVIFVWQKFGQLVKENCLIWYVKWFPMAWMQQESPTKATCHTEGKRAQVNVWKSRPKWQILTVFVFPLPFALLELSKPIFATSIKTVSGRVAIEKSNCFRFIFDPSRLSVCSSISLLVALITEAGSFAGKAFSF